MPEETSSAPKPAERHEPVPSTVSPFRKAFGPLLGYHVLLLTGAFLLISGILGASRVPTAVGWVLIGAGIAVQLAVLVWAASLIGRAVPSQAAPRVEADLQQHSARGGRWICVGCGWREGTGPGFCPRCGRVAVRIPLLSRVTPYPGSDR